MPNMQKFRKILLFVLILPALFVLLLACIVLNDLQSSARIGPLDYDEPELLVFLAERTEQYILRSYPDRDSPERKTALKKLEDIALLDVSDEEKCRLIRERFPEESFWNEDMKSLLHAAEAGDPEAQFQLGCFYFGVPQCFDPLEEDDYFFEDTGLDRDRGKCIVKSTELAGKWFRRAAQQGHTKAQSRLAFAYRYGGHPVVKSPALAPNKKEAIAKKDIRAWLNAAAENGDFLANIAPYAVERKYDSSDDPATHSKRIEKQLGMLREAAAQDNVPVSLLLLLAQCTTDSEESGRCYRRAAGLGSVRGMLEYASVFEARGRKRIAAEMSGDGDEDAADGDEYEDEDESVSDEIDNEDLAEARQWNQRAFDAAMKHLDEGSARDLYEWCMVIYRDNVVASPVWRHSLPLEQYIGDEEKSAFVAQVARRLFELLEQDNEEAFFIMRILNLFSQEFKDLGIEGLDGGTINLRLAQCGVIPAQEALAARLLTGTGVPQDKPEAVRLLRKFAGFGSPFAQRKLGECCLNGDGVPQDTAEAVKWLRKAAMQGDDEARFLLRATLLDSGNPWHWLQSLEWTIRMELAPYYDTPIDYLFGKLNEMWHSLGQMIIDWQK